MSGPLSGIRVFDLTRILAGPTATQMLGDLGADVIKIERPGAGDDTRKWGPPFIKDSDGKETSESAYYLAINRNKKSVTLDIAKPEGQEIAKRLIAQVRRVRREFQGRRHGALQPRLRADQDRLPAPDLLLDHRLRPDRPLRAARRLRFPGAGHGRHHVDQRRSFDPAAEGRGRRHRHHLRHLFRRRHPGGAAAPAPDRAADSRSTWRCSIPRSAGSPMSACST